MNLAEGERSISNYPAAPPRDRSPQATLTSSRLVWLSDSQEEHYPLDKITCVTYGFERARRSLTWAVILLVSAIVLGSCLAWAHANLPALAESMVKTLSDSESPARIEAARRAYLQRVDTLSLLILPLWGLAGAMMMYAIWLLYTGVRGETRVLITSFAVTRVLARRGRDPQLLEFGELVAQRSAGLETRPEAEPEFDQSMLNWIPAKKAKA